jgi:hypothetical protein
LITPNHGSHTAQTPVVILGTNFKGATCRVSMAAVPCVVVGTNAIGLDIPPTAAAGAVYVDVVTPAGTARTTFRYT